MTSYVSRESDADGIIAWSDEENQIWSDLIKRQLSCIEGKACNEYMAGLQRLIENKAFTACASSIEITKQWRVEADQVAQFVEESCETGPQCRAISADLFNRYHTWAEAAGVRRTLNRNNFTNRLRRLGYEPDRGTGGTRMVAGIQPRPMSGFGVNQYAAIRGR